MTHAEKKVYCAAGISHVLLYPNGDVYRCMADYNAKRKPLFNIRNEWKPLGRPELCTHEKCYAACDIDWASKWIYEAHAKSPRVIKAQCPHLPWAFQTFERPLKDAIHIIWAPTLLCNYSCIYCGCAIGKHTIFETFPSASPELSTDEWMAIWSAIREKYKFGIVSITGGEPLLSKATLPIIKMLSDKFALDVTTNLSANVMEIVRYGIKPGSGVPDRAGLSLIIASPHPTSKDFNRELFFGSLLYLKNNGFNISVNFVGYPLQLFLAEEYKEWCKKHRISFVLSPWCGYDNHGFMAHYTDTEEIFLNKMASAGRNTGVQIEFVGFRCLVEADTKGLTMRQGQRLTLKGRVKNASTVPWLNKCLQLDEAYKFGGKISKYGDEKTILKDLRAALPDKDILPDEVCDFAMDVDIAGLPKGVYALRLDVVKEHCFWFEDKGNEPLEIKLNIQ